MKKRRKKIKNNEDHSDIARTLLSARPDGKNIKKKREKHEVSHPRFFTNQNAYFIKKKIRKDDRDDHKILFFTYQNAPPKKIRSKREKTSGRGSGVKNGTNGTSDKK